MSEEKVVGTAEDEGRPLLNSGKVERGFPFSWLSLVGPGLLCCLADTDAGCLIVAAESGAKWKYSLLLLQILLVPVLFWAQELTVRLGVYTQQGHTACIRDHFGKGWAWFATCLLVLECVAAMVSEISGITGVAEMWGAPKWLAVMCAVLTITLIVFLFNYRQIEIFGVCLGLFELTFVFTMFHYHPMLVEVAKGSITFHSDPEYLNLISSNMGAVIMPWMIYFQQSAIVARGLKPGKDCENERSATFFGCCLTQLVMIGTLVTLAASRTSLGGIHSVQDIADALAPQLGETLAKVLVSLAFLGGAGCAAFVVSLAASWALCEALEVEDVACSLDSRPRDAPYFYGAFAGVAAIGPLIIMLGGVDTVRLNVIIELMDGMLLPFALGFLYLLAIGEALPSEVRLQGCGKWCLGVLFTLCVILSVTSAVAGFVMPH